MRLGESARDSRMTLCSDYIRQDETRDLRPFFNSSTNCADQLRSSSKGAQKYDAIVSLHIFLSNTKM